jgi:dihydrofolate reductase
MRRVIYSVTMSADGYIADRDGNFGWSVPDEELHQFHNDRVREQDAQLLGRRLDETMVYWETALDDPAVDPVARDFAEVWLPLPKVVFSRTLDRVEGNARLAMRSPAEELADLDGTIGVGGADLAGQLMQEDLIDEYHLFVAPAIVGGGTPAFHKREGGVLGLELAETRTFTSRAVYMRLNRR